MTPLDFILYGIGAVLIAFAGVSVAVLAGVGLAVLLSIAILAQEAYREWRNASRRAR